MSDLVRKIQRAILTGSGPETLHALLVELQIVGNLPRQADAFERFRRAMLFSGTSESELRSALSDLGLTGGGGGDPKQALAAIRAGLLRNL